MNSTKEIGLELKQKLDSKASLEQIADWAYDIFYKNANDIDSKLENILLTLFTMKGGPEYHLTDLQLRMIALDMIYAEDNDPATKERIGLELMDLLLANKDIYAITGWASESGHTGGLNKEVRDILYRISFAGEDPNQTEPFDEEGAKLELRFLANMLIYNEKEPLKKYLDLVKSNQEIKG